MGITVKSLKKGAESLGLNPKKIKDEESGIEYIEEFLKGEGAELDAECPTCEKDIPDAVDLCPYCGEEFDDGKDPEPEPEPEPEPKEDLEPEEDPESKKGPEPAKKPKKGEGKKEVTKKNKEKGKAKAKPKTETSGDGDKMVETLIAALERQPLVKKEVAVIKPGVSRTSFWGPKGLIAKIFSAKGVAWMYMKEVEKNLVKLGGSKLHIRTMNEPVKGLPTRYDLPSVGEVKNAVKVLIGLAEEAEVEAEKEEKKAPKKDKTDKKAKKTEKKKTQKKDIKKKTTDKKKATKKGGKKKTK